MYSVWMWGPRRPARSHSYSLASVVFGQARGLGPRIVGSADRTSLSDRAAMFRSLKLVGEDRFS